VGLHQSFSKEFKESLVQKVLNRGDATVDEVCSREGVGKSTVANWVRKYATLPGMKKPTSAKKWSAEAKFKALQEISRLSEAEVGVYLRKEGLYSHQLAEWRADVIKSLDEARARPQGLKRDARDDRIKELERDLSRMEKALAEASARMMLQKKVDLFWEKRDRETKK
jgi:transposase